MMKLRKAEIEFMCECIEDDPRVIKCDCADRLENALRQVGTFVVEPNRIQVPDADDPDFAWASVAFVPHKGGT